MSQRAEPVALISGASGGLGEAVVRAFLEAGYHVVGVASKWSGRAPAPPYLALEADLTRAEDARRAVSETLDRLHRIDVLVHLVGGFAGGKPVSQTDEQTWDHMMNLNLRSAFCLFRAVLPHMIEARRGRIVAVGSRTGLEPAPGLSAYGVSKAGLIHLVRTVAAEVRNSGITANVVLPSVIDTPANRAASPNADYSRWVAPYSIAALILWLASDAAADVSGAAIPIYGGA